MQWKKKFQAACSFVDEREGGQDKIEIENVVFNSSQLEVFWLPVAGIGSTAGVRPLVGVRPAADVRPAAGIRPAAGVRQRQGSGRRQGSGQGSFGRGGGGGWSAFTADPREK